MKGKKIHSILLIWFHLVVFAFPLFTKAFHNHDGKPLQHVSGNYSYSKAEVPCYICKYEFVSFIDIQTKSACDNCFYVEEIGEISNYNYYFPVFSCFKHRGPPLNS